MALGPCAQAHVGWQWHHAGKLLDVVSVMDLKGQKKHSGFLFCSLLDLVWGHRDSFRSPFVLHTFCAKCLAL